METSEEETWQLLVYDPFCGEAYPLSRHANEAECREAARAYLREIELAQPTEQSGGQQGIQDRVFVVAPGGAGYVYTRTLDA